MAIFNSELLNYQRVRQQFISSCHGPSGDPGSPHQKANGAVSRASWKIPNHGCLNQWEFQDPKIEVPTIYKAYFSGLSKEIYPQNMAKHMVQYLHFRILEFPLLDGLSQFMEYDSPQSIYVLYTITRKTNQFMEYQNFMYIL